MKLSDRSVAYRFLGDFSNLTAGLTAASRNVRELGAQMTATDRNGQRMRAGLTTVGNAGGKVGLLFAGGVALAVRAAANFDQAMSNVAATGEDARANLDGLREAAIEAGAATQYSATEAAAGIENLLKAGVSAADVLGGGLDGALSLAAAGQIEVADAAEYAASAMTQFKLSGDDVGHVADLLAAAAGKAQGEVSDFGAALQQSGLVAAQTGLSIEETTGALAAFASAGLLGSDAGTSLKTFLQSLTPSSDKAAEAMERMGFSAYDADGNFKGLTTVAGDLKNGLSTMSAEQQNATLKTIFGSDAVRAASILYSQGADGIQSWIDKVNDQGYAAEVAAYKMDNLKGDLEQLGGAFETALIGSAEGSQGPLRTLVQDLTSVVNAFNNLSSPAKSATLALAGLAAVIGGGLFIGAHIVNGIAATRVALQQLGIQATTVTTAMKGMAIAAGVATSLIILGTAIRAVNDAARDTLPGVQGLTEDLIGLSRTGEADQLGKQFQDLGDDLDRILDKSFDESFGDKLYTPFKAILGNTRDTQEALDEIEALDGALANLATTRGPEEAAAALQSLADSGVITDTQLSSLKKNLPQYEEALAGLRLEADDGADSATGAAGATDQYAGSMDGAASAAVEAAEAIADARKAMEDQADAAIGAFDAVTAYRQAVKDAAKQAKDSDDGIAGSSDAMLKNREVLGNLASTWNAQSNAVTDNIKKYREARKNFLETAEAMGVPKKVAQELADTLLEMPQKKVIPVTTPGADEAKAKLQAVKNFLDGLRDKTIHVTTIANRIGGGSVTSTGGGHSDNEGPVKKKAVGGFIIGPGGPTDDRVPIRASAGEYVVRASSVSKYGLSMMDALNAGRYASGGLIASTYVRRSGEQDGGDAATGGAFHAAAAGAANVALRLQLLKVALDESKKSLDKETNARDAAIAARDAFDAAVGSAYAKADPFSGGLSGFDAAVAANTNDTQAAQTALGTAAGNGLDGALYQALATSGNLELLQEFAGLSAYQIDQRERQYAGMQAAQTALGDSAAATAGLDKTVQDLSKEVREQARTNRDLQQTIRHLEAALPKSVEKGAHSGTKSGTEGKNKNVAAQVWTQGRPMKGHHR